MRTLNARKSELASPTIQLEKLHNVSGLGGKSFTQSLREASQLPFRALSVQTLQINLGKMCNQTCAHCHVDAGPDRKEIMSRETMEACLRAVDRFQIKTVDLTGGAPEMNPNFRWFVESIRGLGAHVMDRCNLSIILANDRYNDLPLFFKEHQVEVVSSLPHYTSVRTNRQRGDGVFEKSIRALRMLNEVGYGHVGTELKLNLVYNPAGAFLPGSQPELERDFKDRLLRDHGVVFNNLFCITNMPISRYLEYLLQSGNFESYMDTLVKAFNPVAAEGVMCRSLISVGWDGELYDCDFNQMLGLRLKSELPQHISEFDLVRLAQREIVLDQHCYGCTAGSGSSCGGTTA